MSRRSPNDRLSALLAEADWSAGELARAVNRLGAAQSLTLRYDRTSVAHWLSGSKPREAVVALVAAAFCRRLGRFVTVEDTGLDHSAPEPGLRRPGKERETTSLARLVILTRADASPERRSLLMRSPYRVEAVPSPDWQPQPSWIPVPGARHRATQEDVRAMRSFSETVAAQLERFGGRHGRSALVAYLADDVSRVLTASAPDLLRRTLLVSAAQLTQLLAMMTEDAGCHGLAQIYYHVALDLARDSGNAVAYGLVLRAMSVQALQMDHPRRALELAQSAVDVSGSSAHGAALAFLLSQQAVTHAYDGQRHAAIRDLVVAEASLERASNVPGPFTAYPRAGLEYQRAQALLALRLPVEALSSLRDSARHRDSERRRTSALTEFRLGEVLMAMGHLEEACVHWNRFLDHCLYLHSARVDQSLAQLHQMLRPHQRQRHASSVWERICELIAHPA
ncbi:hypothetical protein [Streptomyces sp. L2]|uniref:hypothetical protein n=1 Tax=Streptomyces sp. L2 TaxID=2162665 RepID=UPI001010386C|nr:hypothetical protein [Streptomyces sp. L2]